MPPEFGDSFAIFALPFTLSQQLKRRQEAPKVSFNPGFSGALREGGMQGENACLLQLSAFSIMLSEPLHRKKV